ncbi:unnamed protein product [Penicillium roqueforti FM164]|uniref:Uncharacterized protein n=1 Tax=Penicillium roqueforti (strain FM164) TaxID=1365484 RepID=W6QLX0_PENRF|nr:unnamed protein product [Penicillium roqueforti FM164]
MTEPIIFLGCLLMTAEKNYWAIKLQFTRRTRIKREGGTHR